MVKIILLCILLCSCGSTYTTGGVLVSKPKLYPAYVKTPQDINDWLIAEGFYYKLDKTKKDEWKTPEQTIKDKGNDCEDYAILVHYILKDLGYKNVMIMAIYGKSLAHGITWFQEKDGSWSFFSVGVNLEGDKLFYWDSKLNNAFYILNNYFPKWVYIKLCTPKGINVKTFYRKDVFREE